MKFPYLFICGDIANQDAKQKPGGIVARVVVPDAQVLYFPQGAWRCQQEVVHSTLSELSSGRIGVTQNPRLCLIQASGEDDGDFSGCT